MNESDKVILAKVLKEIDCLQELSKDVKDFENFVNDEKQIAKLLCK